MTKTEFILLKDYNPEDLTYDLLYNTNDWDLIELNYDVDVARLTKWYSSLREEFNDLHFKFDQNSDKLNLEVSGQMVKEGYCGIYCGPIEGLTLAWPKERYEPLPPPKQANPDVFPEVNYETYNTDAKILSRFRTGYFAELIDILGEDSFRQAIITTHYPGMKILQHIDSKVLKLHIPIETNTEAYFHFGKDKELGKYNLKVGKIYILNTGDWHGTSNEGTVKRSHIITRVSPEQIQQIIRL